MSRSARSVAVLSLLVLVLTGCFNSSGGVGTGSGTGGFTVTGVVMDPVDDVTGGMILADDGNGGMPLRGATVRLGSRSTVTGPNGTFTFTGVPSGEHTLTVILDGYEAHSETVRVSGDGVHVTVEIEPAGGRLDITGTEFADLDGAMGDTTVTIRGNVNDLLPGSEPAAASFSVWPLTTAITVAQLQALINGTIHTIEVERDGSFEQVLPIDPGSNTIQLRVFDTNGIAYTTPIVRVTSTIERLDLRIVMSWDTATDVDLHLLKRDPGERNPRGTEAGQPGAAAWWSSDRHVGYYNKVGDDFGDSNAEHAFLDIDDTAGYGPETIVLQEATPGYYHIWVHMFSIRNVDVTNVTVDVIVNEPGRPVPLYRTFTKQLTEHKEYWYVGTVSYPGGQIIEVPPTVVAAGMSSLEVPASALEK